MRRGIVVLVMLVHFVWGQNRLSPTAYNFAKISIGMGSPVFLEIGSEHCKPCLEMGEILYNLKQKFPNVKIFYINIDSDREFLEHLNLMVIPTQIIFDGNGKEVYRHVGELSFMQLQKILCKYKTIFKDS
ncbi:MAG: thioredoxin family protein [Epsilonproteobacteria bacterium]|nr:thioredoxin family protein [Campylobacterota bacterium]